LVNACHQHGLAVVLDIVYNHLGPEGNYLAEFGPYFTDRYKTPWGPAVNFDGPHSDEVRHFFIENALYWVAEFHIDALRLDAVHAIFDRSAHPFLQDLTEAVHRQADLLNRQIYVIAESNLNDSRLVRPLESGGQGLDAQWNDDFHHALRTLLTDERVGYYRDFGEFQQLIKAYREGYVYSGEYSAYRQRRHGNSPRALPAERFVVFSQNHDQVGNRMLGDRLTATVSFEGLKVAAGAVMLSPFIPLLFMGEEYGETTPFQYFVSHSDPSLIEAVRQGRKQEFDSFLWQGDPPDPQDEATFLRSKLNWQLRSREKHKVLLEFYEELIKSRKTSPALALLSKGHMEVIGLDKQKILYFHRWAEGQQVFGAFHFADARDTVDLPVPTGRWTKRLDSCDKRWLGDGSTLPEQLVSQGEVTVTLNPVSLALFCKEDCEASLA
jgi:maltooligosyltrehalose trehalohydrolase